MTGSVLSIARGKSLHMRARVTRAGALVRPGPGVHVAFLCWAPGTATSGVPHGCHEASWDGDRSWEATVPTSGWEPGTWTVQARVEDARDGRDEPVAGWDEGHVLVS